MIKFKRTFIKLFLFLASVFQTSDFFRTFGTSKGDWLAVLLVSMEPVTLGLRDGFANHFLEGMTLVNIDESFHNAVEKKNMWTPFC